MRARVYVRVSKLLVSFNPKLVGSYSLMALGSSAYPNFCNAGKTMDELLHRLGAERLCDLHLGDAVHGQAQSVRDWQVRPLRSS